MSNFNRVATWLHRCGKRPNNAAASVQLGVHFEEIAELLLEISLVGPTGASNAAMQEVANILEAIGTNLKQGHITAIIHNREAALDALCDADVTGNGLAYLLGMDKAGADIEVVQSLFDKFKPDGTPVILPGGKIGKREGWVAPSLAQFVTPEAASWVLRSVSDMSYVDWLALDPEDGAGRPAWLKPDDELDVITEGCEFYHGKASGFDWEGKDDSNTKVRLFRVLSLSNAADAAPSSSEPQA